MADSMNEHLQQKGNIFQIFLDNIHEDVVEEELFTGKLLHFHFHGHVIPIDTKRIKYSNPDQFYIDLSDYVYDEVNKLLNLS